MFLALICGSLAVYGQVSPNPPRPPNRITLTVRVKRPDGRALQIPAAVEVISSFGVSLAENFTHDDGLVEFLDIPSGTYRLRVSGAGLETVTGEPFDIGDNDRTHFESVAARFAPDASSSGSPTVSSQDFAVPAKARDEMEKGMDAFAKGDAKNAGLHIEQAIQIYPRYALAYYNLGVVLGSQGDRPAAEAAFQKSVEADTHFVPGFIILARMKSATENVQAMGLLEKALAIDPNNLDALALLARLQFNRGDFDAALATVQKVHAQPHEHFADVHLIAAEIYQKRNRNAEALAESEMYLKESPDSPRAAQVRAAMEQIKARKQ